MKVIILRILLKWRKKWVTLLFQINLLIFKRKRKRKILTNKSRINSMLKSKKPRNKFMNLKVIRNYSKGSNLRMQMSRNSNAVLNNSEIFHPIRLEIQSALTMMKNNLKALKRTCRINLTLLTSIKPAKVELATQYCLKMT